MITLFELIKSNKKILGKIAVCKLVEGFFILLTVKFLVEFIDSPSEKFLALTFGFFAGRIILSGMTEKFFAELSADVQTEFRKKIHAQIFIDEISAGELLTLTFDALKSLDEFFLKVAPHVASAIIFLPTFLICAAFVDWL
ncbi:MAG: hypothetical protein IJ685_08820, partial [Selenomonadaceae bacterium]|nr:hypothetical protein [Selenomonadaceae bacterium]